MLTKDEFGFNIAHVAAQANSKEALGHLSMKYPGLFSEKTAAGLRVAHMAVIVVT